jgi:hypothetical protein
MGTVFQFGHNLALGISGVMIVFNAGIGLLCILYGVSHNDATCDHPLNGLIFGIGVVWLVTALCKILFVVSQKQILSSELIVLLSFGLICICYIGAVVIVILGWIFNDAVCHDDNLMEIYNEILISITVFLGLDLVCASFLAWSKRYGTQYERID